MIGELHLLLQRLNPVFQKPLTQSLKLVIVSSIFTLFFFFFFSPKNLFFFFQNTLIKFFFFFNNKNHRSWLYVCDSYVFSHAFDSIRSTSKFTNPMSSKGLYQDLFSHSNHHHSSLKDHVFSHQTHLFIWCRSMYRRTFSIILLWNPSKQSR